MTNTFGRIGILSFGGPAAQIAVMHRILVDENKWLSEDQFLRALSFCMLLPGPEAMQLATYAGWRLRGITGGLLAGLLFVLPGAFVITALAAIYLSFGSVPAVQALFLGVKAAVVVIVVQTLWRLSNKALKGKLSILLAILAFFALFVFQLPFPLIIITAAIIGAMRVTKSEKPIKPGPVPPHHFTTIAVWTLLWSAPVVVLWVIGADFLLDLSLFFGKLALVTFGGAYAVLAYMTQEVVQSYGWITAPQMIDALGLAETTPGPLILVTQFVGHLAGAKIGGVTGFLIAGALTLWMTFVPCFLWIFAGAPYLERLTAQPRIAAALTGVTAAVVGVIANLSLWFALNVFFSDLRYHSFGAVNLLAPDIASFQPIAAILCIFAAILIFVFKYSIPKTLALVATFSFCLFFWLSSGI